MIRTIGALPGTERAAWSTASNLLIYRQTDAQKAEWRVYRQALRDVPETGIWPNSPDQTG